MSDPTKTVALRRSFYAEGNRRLARLRSQTHAILVEHDLMAAKNSPLAQFLPNPGDRLSAFVEWFENTANFWLRSEDWWSRFLRRAYESGVVAGRELVDNPHAATLPVPAVYRELAAREFAGIVASMTQQVARRAGNAALGQLKPSQVYREVLVVLSKSAPARMKAAVNTMTVQLHNAGRLAQFRAAGITQVGIDPERLEPTKASRFLRKHDHGHLVLHDLTAAQELRRFETQAEQRRQEAEARAVASELELERERAELARQVAQQLEEGRILAQTRAVAQAELEAARAQARAEVAAARAATAEQEREAAAQWERVKAAREAERKALYPQRRPEEGPPRKVPPWQPPPGVERAGQVTVGVPPVPPRLAELGEFVNALTAGDDKVCVYCEELSANGPYSIEEAQGLLPLHVNCRCAWIPAFDMRYQLNRELAQGIEQ